MTVYFFTELSKLTYSKGVTADISSCKQGLLLVDIYRHCNLKSHARAAHERKRERGSGVVMACHFPTLVCSNAAGFACHSKCSACWQTAEVVARENTLRRHPGNGMSGNVGCFLKLIMYSPINLRSAINCWFYYFF